MGAACVATNTITLREDLPFSRKVDVFFHELSHLCTASYGESLPGEVVAIVTGNMMLDFIRHNPEMVVGICDELAKED